MIFAAFNEPCFELPATLMCFGNILLANATGNAFPATCCEKAVERVIYMPLTHTITTATAACVAQWFFLPKGSNK